MELIYYRNFLLESFLSEADINLSDKYNIQCSVSNNRKNSNELLIESIKIDRIADFSLYPVNNAIQDAKVIVGANGVGKSTIFDEILGFIIQSDVRYSGSLLIGKGFILIGGKIKLKKECLEQLENTLGPLTLYTRYSDDYHSYHQNRELLISNKSFVQAISKGKASVFFYSNSIDNHKLPHLSGDLYSRSELAEEAISLVDISTANMLILSNKWGLDSMLRELVKEDHLISLDNYQMLEFLELYFQTDWFSELIPIDLYNRLNIRVHFSPLIYKFNSALFAILGYEPILKNYPNFHTLSKNTARSHFSGLYTEFISALILKTLDKIYEPSSFLKNITEVLDDFEESTKAQKLQEHNIDNETIVHVLELYIKNSRKLHFIGVGEIYSRFRNLIQVLLADKNISQQFTLNGLDDVRGLIFNLNKDQKALRDLVNIYSALQSHSNFRLPFLKFTPAQISSGERNYLFLFSRLVKNIDSLGFAGGRPDNFTILMDEPGNDYHPQWQKQFFHNLNTALNNYSVKRRKIKVQLIVSTHSPFILSDFKASQVIKLQKAGKKTVIANYETQTFGSNIHTLLSDSFFLNDGAIGNFAKENIQIVIDNLNKWRKLSPEEIQKLKSAPEFDIEKSYSLNLISIIGDIVLQKKLFEMYFEIFGEDNAIDKEIDALTLRIESLKRRKNDRD
ncbi:MAG: ATPase protein [Bacteroidetes bacterium]|jgi:hypothetical protein|nr:ATPase protein [Bacteroidota bacterium]